MPITSIDDARTMLRMGMPLNTPVEERKFSAAAAATVAKLANAHEQFMTALLKFLDDPSAGSLVKWRLVKKRFDLLVVQVERSDAALTNLPGDEQKLLAIFLFDRAEPFVRYWGTVLDVVDNGGEAVIDKDDMPRWYDH